MDNVIIGSGVFGLATAIELIEQGSNVTVIDSNNKNIASRNALGRLDPIFKGSGSPNDIENNDSIQRPHDQKSLALRSFNTHNEYYKKFYKGTDFEYEFLSIPTLQILNNEDLNELKEDVDQISSLGFSLEILESNDEILNIQKGISSNINKAALIHGTKFINARNFLFSLEERFKSLGGNIINGKAKNIDLLQKKLIINEDDKIKFDNLVICTGPWINDLLSKINAEVEVFPAKGEIIKVKCDDIKLNFHLHGECSIVERNDNLIWIAATHEKNVFNSKKTVQAEEELIKKASKIIPGILNCTVIDHSACVRPSTENGMPIVKEALENSGIYVASGGGGWGIMQCFYIGKLIKDMVS